jgi:lipopolysaccharide export system protein LptC
MSITPMPSAPKGGSPRRPVPARSFSAARPLASRLTRPRRRWVVSLAKRVLPLVALALLSLLALYPEINGNGERNRISYRRVALAPEGGQLTDAHYQGVDDQGRPFTVTATKVRQMGADRTDLDSPKADMQLPSGTWLMLEAQRGIYEQKANRLDLSGDVTLYRDDGTVLQTGAATIDMKSSSAAGHEMVHAEGPFGTLDAQGFAVLDRGAVIQFTGPARLVLNGTQP